LALNNRVSAIRSVSTDSISEEEDDRLNGRICKADLGRNWSQTQQNSNCLMRSNEEGRKFRLKQADLQTDVEVVSITAQIELSGRLLQC
jgi:hypothetical protein